ncbi:hypothetical protein [Paracoccus sp. KR1-242]|uniref:hypothetical protein n=1 Tax=Paracoccus sp. KR1-242 TaxID=3410028 RepID=UPI003C0B1520
MLTVHADRPEGAAIEGRVVLSEISGAEVILHCETALGRLIVASPRQAMAAVPDTV